MNTDVWQNLKAKLAVPYWRANSQGLDSIEWEKEIMALKQLVMTGMPAFMISLPSLLS